MYALCAVRWTLRTHRAQASASVNTLQVSLPNLLEEIGRPEKIAVLNALEDYAMKQAPQPLQWLAVLDNFREREGLR